MNKFLFVAVVALLLFSAAGSVSAQNIERRLGVTGRVGFLIPADSDFNDFKLDTDAGFVGGGGLIYGYDRNIALELDVTHSWFDSSLPSGDDTGEFRITDVALGVQYRFAIADPAIVPYAGGGIDILFNDYEHGNVDTVVGIHGAGGVDYFLTRDFALNAEVKVVLAPDADIERSGLSGNFDPSNFSGTFGVRYFFW